MIPRATNPLPREVSRLTDLAHTVHEFKDTVQIKAVLELLDEIDGQTMQRLRTTLPEHLLREQGKLEQLAALRALLRGEPSNGMV